METPSQFSERLKIILCHRHGVEENGSCWAISGWGGGGEVVLVALDEEGEEFRAAEGERTAVIVGEMFQHGGNLDAEGARQGEEWLPGYRC